MARRRNPYIAGKSVTEGAFFGRRDVLEWVEDELFSLHTDILVIHGQRRIGKTSVLKQLRHTLPKDAFRPVFFDLQDHARKPLGGVLTELAGEIARQLKVPRPDADRQDDDGRYFADDYLPEVLGRLGEHVRLVLLFDEFEVLDQDDPDELPENATARRFHPFLRRLIAAEAGVGFVFATGRATEDLGREVKATFKTSLQKQIWVLDRPSAEALIRQGEAEDVLRFSNGAVDRILELTSGHPFLTQLLCHRIWLEAERRQRHEPLPPGVEERRQRSVTVEVGPELVEAAIPATLERGDNALVWIWEGLVPAERVFTSALAEDLEEGETLSREAVLEAISRRSPERRTREVEEAPRALVKQKLLAEEGEEGLRFEVDLLRQWVQERKPLREVEEELDRLKPEAEAAFQAGESLRRKKRWSMALRSYEEAVRIDPQHVSAHVALGECYLKTDLTRKAVEILEHAHRIDPRRARIELVNALLQYADEQEEENVALNLCDRVLELSPEEPRARRKKAEIWKARGDAHLLNRNRSRAHECYRRADYAEGIRKIERDWAQRRRAVGGVAEELEGVARRAWEVANRCEGSRREAADRQLRGGWRRIARAFEGEARIFTELAAGFRAVGEEKWGLADQRYEAVEKELAAEARRLPREASPAAADPEGTGRNPAGEPGSEAENPSKRLSGVLTGLLDGARERVSGYLRGGGEQRAFDGLQRRPPAGGEGGESTEGDPEVRDLLRSVVALRDAVQKIQGSGWSSVETLFDDPVSRRYLEKTREILRRRDATLGRCPPGILALRRRDFAAVEAVFGRIDEEKPPSEVSSAGFAGGDARAAVEAVAPWAAAVDEDEDLEQTMTMRQNRVYRVAFSPERKWIASVSDAALALWLVEDGRQGELLEQRPQRVHDLSFSPAGETVAVASGAGMVTLWSVRTGEAMRVLEHEAPVGCLAFSPDGRLLATGTRSGSLHLWELPQGAPLGGYRLEEPLASLVFSPLGGFLVVGTERGILHLWDVRKKKWGMQPWKQPGKPATPLVFSGDGKLLAWLAGTPEIRLWYVYDKKIRAFKGHRGVVRDLALSPDGDLLASVSEDRVARLWSTRNGAKLAEVKLPSPVVGVDFSPSMAEVVLVYSDKKISIWQLPEMDRPTGGG